ncbi:Methionine ABC transporter ATP-binding protein [hydrothermal vent metagenome]|uniref:Methionine ABC transporter ATP-binding protein n=1 Tax=hydrothermal vent metagenome TaxID=652676 RepID=A0A3B1E6Z1_9ZZZZ
MLRVKSLYKQFGEDAHPLKGASLNIKAGQSVSIMGRSGSGKSTFLNCVAGIESIDKGEVYINDKHIDYLDTNTINSVRKTDIGIIFQQYYLLPRTSVYNQLSLVTQASDDDIDEVLHSLDIFDLKHKNIQDCSGGQQQRVCIARALVKKPKLILADEPTANLDAALAIKSVELMISLSKKINSALLIITHDDRIIPLVDEVYALKEGKIV